MKIVLETQQKQPSRQRILKQNLDSLCAVLGCLTFFGNLRR